jgi:hypothetical protein
MIFLRNPIRVGVPIPSIINWKQEKYLQGYISIVGFQKIELKYFSSSSHL